MPKTASAQAGKPAENLMKKQTYYETAATRLNIEFPADLCEKKVHACIFEHARAAWSCREKKVHLRTSCMQFSGVSPPWPVQIRIWYTYICRDLMLVLLAGPQERVEGWWIREGPCQDQSWAWSIEGEQWEDRYSTKQKQLGLIRGRWLVSWNWKCREIQSPR